MVLIVQFALGMGVNLYVPLPSRGPSRPCLMVRQRHILAFHAALGMFLIPPRSSSW
jgi:hypothetical protein